MRIDTLSYFSTSLPGIRDNQTAIARLNQQIASGMRLLAPKDDPLATNKVLQLSSQVATRSQHVANQDRAEFSLRYEQTVVQEMQKSLGDARGLLNINSGNSQELLNIHAEQLKGTFNQILDLLNTRDSGGNAIFGGFNTDGRPYANASLSTTPTTVQPTTYSGTAAPGGLREAAIEEGRTVQVNDNLYSAFIFTDPSFIDSANGAGANQDNHDLLQNLADAIAKLSSNSATQSEINGYATMIDKVMTRLASVEHRIAGAMGEIEDVRSMSKALLLQEKNALGDIQQVDQAAAIIELQTRQTTLQATEQAYARTANLTLFNFLG